MGALLVAAFIVSLLISGIQTNNWMYNSYNMVFNAAGTLISNGVAQL
jgi:hypothetical protein